LCAGLDAAHAAGVIHRDLKPGNIMLAKTGAGAERVVITDFGLARASAAAGGDGSRSATGAVAGTPEYMAPEQIRGDAATPATDVYALGLILYEMLQGERPFAGKNMADSWMRRIREGPAKLSGVVEDVSPQVDAVIAKCLAFEPGERFRAAGMLPEALQGGRGRAARWWVAAAGVAVILGLGAWGTMRWLGGPGREALLWYQDARRDLAEGAALRASNQLRRALAESPQFPAAHAMLAEAQMELDQISQARESILRASSMTGRGWGVSTSDRMYVEGVSRLLLRECPAAIAAFQAHAEATAVEMRPYAMTSLARAQERCDQGDAARKTLAEAAKLDPRNAAVLVRSALLAHRRRDTAAVPGYLNAAEALYRERSNFEGVTEVLLARGMVANEGDRLEEASTFLGEALQLARTTKNMPQQIRILFQQSNVARRRGTLEEARTLAERSVQLARENDLETLSLQGMFAAANIHTIKNQNRDSADLLERALEIAGRYRDEENQARAQLALAVNYQRLLLPEKAEGALAAAVPYYERIQHGQNLALANYVSGTLAYTGARYVAAEGRFRRALTEAERIGEVNIAVSATGNLARTLLRTGGFEEAEVLYAKALAVTRKSKRKRAEAYALMAHAEALGVMGRLQESKRELEEVKLLIAGLEPEAAVAPARHLRIASAEAAIRERRYTDALAAVQGIVWPPDSPETGFDALAVECEAKAGARNFARALEKCEALAKATGSGRSTGHALRARLVEAEIRVASGDSVAGARIAVEILGAVKFNDDPFTVLFARIVAASSSAHGNVRPDGSQIMDNLRLKLGAPIFLAWSRRPDVAMRLSGYSLR